MSNAVKFYGNYALAKVDDTNVTLTLGGVPERAMMQPTSISVGWQGTLSPARGGLGANASAANGVPLFTGGVVTFTPMTGGGGGIAEAPTDGQQYGRQSSGWSVIDLAAKQPNDATLTALAGLDATAGLVEQTGTDVFAKRALGVAASTSVLTRADGDARYTTATSAVRYDIAQGLTASQKVQARANIAAPLRGWIAGLTLSMAGSSATFGVAAGEASDSTASDLMQLASAYTKTTGAWAVGSGNGALDTGAISAAAWYYAFLIRRPDTGVVDVLVSLSATAPTLPANYTQFRRIGALVTSASLWTKFTQNGDEFLWDLCPVALNGVTGDTVAHLAGVGPASIRTTAIINVGAYCGATGNDGRFYISSPDKSDEAAAVQNFNAGTSTGLANSGIQTWSLLYIRTNAAGQIRYRASNAAGTLYMGLTGWIDRRGRDD